MDVESKITINNKNRNMKALREKVLFQKKNDGNDAERDCYNSIMEKKTMEGKQGTLQKKYMEIESDIIRQQRVRNKNNDFSSDISCNKRTEKQQIEEIMDDVRENLLMGDMLFAKTFRRKMLKNKSAKMYQ